MFSFVQRRSAPSAKNLFVLCCAALALACLSRKHTAPHMWRCQGGLSERSSSFWCLQLSTNPDSSLPSPYLPGVRKTTLASRTLARMQLNLQHSSDNTSQSEGDELVRRACLRACYKVWTIKHNKRQIVQTNLNCNNLRVKYAIADGVLAITHSLGPTGGCGEIVI